MEISREEYEDLLHQKALLEETIAKLDKQEALIESTRKAVDDARKSTEKVVELVKQKSAQESKEARERAKEAEERLRVYEALSNTQLKTQGEGYECEARDKEGDTVMTFRLLLGTEGSVEYVPVTSRLSKMPNFFSENIEFDKGQSAVFFRELLKLTTK